MSEIESEVMGRVGMAGLRKIKTNKWKMRPSGTGGGRRWEVEVVVKTAVRLRKNKWRTRQAKQELDWKILLFDVSTMPRVLLQMQAKKCSETF